MAVLSKTENRVLMFNARESLNGKWGLAIVSCLVAMLVAYAAQVFPGIGTIASLILYGPISLGLAVFSLAISRNQNPVFEQIFEGFQNFVPAVTTYLLALLYIILWSLLLVIPGIIASLSYSQIFYILAEDKNIGSMEAIAKSKEMMNGNKWKFFCLNFRFLGWTLLCLLTAGIGFLWLVPYMVVSYANFYDDLK